MKHFAFIKIDSEGGQVGHLGWINSDTSAPDHQGATARPIRWFGSVLWLKEWPILSADSG